MTGRGQPGEPPADAGLPARLGFEHRPVLPPLGREPAASREMRDDPPPGIPLFLQHRPDLDPQRPAPGEQHPRPSDHDPSPTPAPGHARAAAARQSRCAGPVREALSPEEWWNIYCQRMAEPAPGRIHLGWWSAALLVSLAMTFCLIAGLWTLVRALLALFQ